MKGNSIMNKMDKMNKMNKTTKYRPTLTLDVIEYILNKMSGSTDMLAYRTIGQLHPFYEKITAGVTQPSYIGQVKVVSSEEPAKDASMGLFHIYKTNPASLTEEQKFEALNGVSRKLLTPIEEEWLGQILEARMWNENNPDDLIPLTPLEIVDIKEAQADYDSYASMFPVKYIDPIDTI